MEIFAFLGIILLLGFFIGSVISYVNLSSINTLKRQVLDLQRRLSKQLSHTEYLERKLNQLSTSFEETHLNQSKTEFSDTNNSTSTSSQNAKSSNKSTTSGDDISDEAQRELQSPSTKSDNAQSDKEQSEKAQRNNVNMSASSQRDNVAPSMRPNAAASQKPLPNTASGSQKSQATQTTASFSLDSFLSGNGLLWIGAIILSLGGVFLAKYSIEAGLLPPHVRIIAGAVFGIALVFAAEYLYRHPKKFQIQSELISGALASAGLITCFAMTLVAFDFYAYLSPLFAFGILAIISISATWLSIRYGPILAAIGLVGAYIVPALVSTGSNNIFALLSYLVFVSASAIWVYHIVKREWLWWLAFGAHFLWLGLAVFIGDMSDVWIIFAYILVSLYLFVIAPVLGWKCTEYNTDAMPTKMLLMPRKEQLGLLVSLGSIIGFYIIHGFDDSLYVVVALMSVVLLMAPYRHSAFDTWPFLSLAMALFTLVMAPQTYDFSDNLFPFGGVLLFIQIAALVLLVHAFVMIKFFAQRHSYLLMLVLAPLSLYALSYAIFPIQASEFLYPVWSIQLALYAVAFVVLSIRTQNLMHKASFLLLSNGAISLVLTMLLSAGTLSIALSLQVAMISIVARKYALELPSWILKIAIAILLLRFTAAPWLEEYSNQVILGLHWSIVVYPIAFICFYFAKQFQKPALHAWLDGAMLHIVALFVTTETSYFLQGRYLSLDALTWHESVLLGMNWLILAGVYLWRKQHTSLHRLYEWFAVGLSAGAGLMHVNASIIKNPLIQEQSIGSHILLNWLFPLWLVPSIVLLGFLYFQLVKQSLRRYLWVLSAGFAALYVNAIIRFAYNDGVSLFTHNIGQTELYTYSIVWLIVAAALIVLAQKWAQETMNKVGFAVLALVVLKAFLIDLSNLDGLYRALSFIGLGLSLVAIGWLFQRFKHTPQSDEGASEPASSIE